MKKYYTQSICTLSIAVPIVIALILFLIISIIKNTFLGDFEANKVTYKTELGQLEQLAIIKKNNLAKEQQLALWQDLLSGDGYNKVNEQLRKSVKTYDQTNTLLITESNRSSNSNNGVDAKQSSADFALQGTFTELQLALTDLESRMPNLMLNRVSISPQSNSKLLDLKLNYTIWNK